MAEVPREAFIPETIWVAEPTSGMLAALSKQDDPEGWRAAVDADAPVITQVDFGETPTGRPGRVPSSSCSMPPLVAQMLRALNPDVRQRVLEIGTGTGWNAALLTRRVGADGRVVSVEVDPVLADQARTALTDAGFHALVVTADGEIGFQLEAPYDRVIATASIREVVPPAWLDQLRRGGRLVAPWGTDWSNGVLLTLDKAEEGTAIGRFSGNLAFMRLRQQRRTCYGWEPTASQIGQAELSSTECRGADLDRMLNPDKGLFAIGARLDSCCLEVEWDKLGERHHVLELDDGASRSWARLDADLDDPRPFRVFQLGPRKLWDEAEAAYDWWHDQGEPTMDRFGLHIHDGRRWLWLDEPDNVVRTLQPPTS